MTRPVVFLLLTLVTAGVYLPGLTGGFSCDDHPNIVDNPALRIHGFDSDTVHDARRS